MDVVNHQSGSPRSNTTLQKDKATRERVRTFSGVSGGGDLVSDIGGVSRGEYGGAWGGYGLSTGVPRQTSPQHLWLYVQTKVTSFYLVF
jgi:hypothetical protein